MLRSYWGVFVALIGLALAGAQQTQAAASPTPTPEPTYRPYPDYNPDPCYRAENHDSADLCAQWRAALAAEKAAHESRRATNWGIAATFLSLATVVGLIITILQTQGALSEARRGNRLNLQFERRARRESRESSAAQERALEIAERNADSAAAQVSVSEEMSHRQLRAYVEVTEVSIVRSDESTIPSIRILVQNGGLTPAYKCMSYFQAVGVPGGDREDDLPEAIPPKPTGCKSILGGGVQVSGVPLLDWEENIPKIIGGKLIIFLNGWIKYTDIFGGDHETKVRHFIDAGSIQSEMGISVASKGNSST